MRYIILISIVSIFLSASNLSTKPSVEDDKLRLMFQVFTYSEDLQNAYRVGKKALKIYPNSIYWHQKMAEISQWLDKREEAIEHYSFLYEKRPTKKLEKKILNYSIDMHQYERAVPILYQRVVDNPSDENVKNLIYIYDKVGTPEESAKILEKLSYRDRSNSKWLKEALRIYIEIGEDELASKLVKRIEKREKISKEMATVVSNYYISQRDMNSSYSMLIRADILNDKNSTEYYKKVSDIGWYLQDFKNGAEASLKLYNNGQARLIDYERILYYYGDSNSTLMEDITKDGYDKFGKEYLYITYLNTLFENKKYEKLSLAFDRVDGTKISKSIEKNVYFWMMKGQMYAALGKKEMAIEAFHKALLLEPESPHIIEALLWFYIDNRYDKLLKDMIFDLEESMDIDSTLWLPLAVANFAMQRSDRAMSYVKALMESNRDNIDIKFMYAYLMQSREESGAFMKMMREIFKTLEAKRLKNPKLMKDKEFLENYLSCSMYFIPVDDFEELLVSAKEILDSKKYIELSIYWALRHNAYGRAKYLIGKLSNIEPWMRLGVALNDNDHMDIQDILYRHYAILPIRDRVLASRKISNISMGQTLSFEGELYNRYDYLLYKQRLDLIKEHSDRLDIKSGHLVQGSLDQSYMDMRAKYYIARGWSLNTDIYLATNRNKNRGDFLEIPTNDKSIDMVFKRELDRGYMEIGFGFRDAMDRYSSLYTKVDYEISSRVKLDLSYKNGTKSSETTYLLLGGKKDEFSSKIALQYLPSSSISLFMAYSGFDSQDDIYLGDGYHIKLEWYQQLHSGYPDIAWGLFTEYGDYNEQRGFRGVMDDILPYDDADALPERFCNLGANFFYGVMNKESYTRVWRPYAEFSPYYNGYHEQFNLSASAGIGGSIYDKDHLSIGAGYDQSLNGTQESSIKLYMKYMMFF